MFHPTKRKRGLPTHLPKLSINGEEIGRDPVTKILAVMIDENLSWKSHIQLIRNKISKSIGILYKTRQILEKTRLKQLYFSFISSYLSYADVVRATA